MAIVLGQKLVQDTEKYEDYAIGISLPIQIGNTAFNQTFTTNEQIKSNVKNLLLTKKGERVMQPNFGSGLQELLFDFNDFIPLYFRLSYVVAIISKGYFNLLNTIRFIGK